MKILLALAAGTAAIVYLTTRKPKKALAAKAPGAGLPLCDFDSVKAFNEAHKTKTGAYHNIYWVETPLEAWKAPNAEYLADTTSVVFSTAACEFYTWNGSSWEPSASHNQAYWAFLGKDKNPACFTPTQLLAFQQAHPGGTGIIYNTYTKTFSGSHVGERQFVVDQCQFLVWNGQQWVDDEETTAFAGDWKAQQ